MTVNREHLQMKIEVENTGPCRKTLSIEMPAESVTAEYEKAIQRSADVAVIPGYRKGKAPPALVERHYRKAIEQEVRDHLIFRSYREALERKQINPVAMLNLTDVTLGKGRPMTYKVVLDVPPEFKLPKYKSISLKPNKVEVSDEQVQKQFEMLLDRLAKHETVEGRPVRKGDLVQIDYEGTCDGKPLTDLGKAAAGLGQGRDFWVAADENAFLPGFDTGLLGMSKGEEKEIQVGFPPDFRLKDVAGKTAVYRVTVKALREKRLPAMDKEFLEQWEVDSEDALRAKLRESLLAEAEDRDKERLKGEIISLLLSKTSIDLPESLVQEETRRMFSSMVRRNLQRGISREQLNGQKEQLLDTATKSAGDRVKLGYILHRIAEEENIAVDETDLDQSIQRLAARYRVAPEVLRKELEEKKELDSVRHEIRTNKTLDFLLENANTGGKGFLGRLMTGG